jgi:hypothetical protein
MNPAIRRDGGQYLLPVCFREYEQAGFLRRPAIVVAVASKKARIQPLGGYISG